MCPEGTRYSAGEPTCTTCNINQTYCVPTLIEGCHCPTGDSYENGQCVSKTCTCITEGGDILKSGESYEIHGKCRSW